MITDVASAELIKYASNGFLAVKISFINEIARLCELMGADVHDVARGMGLDRADRLQVPAPGPRLRRLLLPQGHVRGGRPRPPARLRRSRSSRRRSASTRETKARMIEKIAAAVGPARGQDGGRARPLLQARDRRHPRVPGARRRRRTAEGRARRSAPSIRRRCANTQAALPRAPLRADAYDCAAGADFVVLATEWNEFRALDLARLAGPADVPNDDRPAQRLRPEGDASGRLDLRHASAGLEA